MSDKQLDQQFKSRLTTLSAKENLETLARWEKYQETGVVVSNTEIMNWLDSWGSDREKQRPVK